MLVKRWKITGKIKFEHNNFYIMISIRMFSILYDCLSIKGINLLV